MVASCQNERVPLTYSRAKRSFRIGTLSESRHEAQGLFRAGQYLDTCDLYELIYVGFPGQAIEVLAELFDLFQTLPKEVSRYELYEARLFDFRLMPSDRVLDIGSGNDPFPLATHLADIALEDDVYGRARRSGESPISPCMRVRSKI